MRKCSYEARVLVHWGAWKVLLVAEKLLQVVQSE